MKKFLALFLTLVLLAGLTACKTADAADPAQEQNTVTAPTNDATFVYQPDDPTLIPAGGQTIALVTGPSGTENGADAMLWQGVQTFANTYGYTADTYAAAGNTADDAETARVPPPRAAQGLSSARARLRAKHSTASRTTTPMYTTCCSTMNPTTPITAPTRLPNSSTASSSRKNRPGIWRATPS